jgi:PilX N-terminal
MHTRPPARSDETGAALLIVILLIALMLSLGAVSSRTSQIELRIAANDVMNKQAFESAEAGLNHAFALLKLEDAERLNEAADGFDDELSAGGVGGALAALGDVHVLEDGQPYRFAQLSGQSGSDGYYVRMVDNHDERSGADVPTADCDDTVHLISRGRVGSAERMLDSTVRRDVTAPCVLCGSIDLPILPLDIALAAGVKTDSFDSRDGPYDAATAGSHGHVFSNGDITLTGALLLPVTVKGNVTASRTIVTVAPPVTVTGTKTQNAPPAAFPPVLPCGPPYPPNDGISGGFYNRATGVLVNVGLNDVIDLAPGDYCFSAITMGGASTLRVSGPTHIHLTAPSVFVGVINTTGAAANLRVSSSVVSPLPVLPGAIPAIAFAGAGGQVAMAIDAPQGLVGLAGVADFYGQVIGGVLPDVGLPLPLRLHYDDALDNPGIYRIGWRELRNDPPG